MFEDLSDSELVQRCHEENVKFQRDEPNDPDYGLALLRRMLRRQSDDLFREVYNLYRKLVLSWACHAAARMDTDSPAEAVADEAFTRFYGRFRGDQHTQIVTLASALAYIKTSVYSIIKDEQRYLIRHPQHRKVTSLENEVNAVRAPGDLHQAASMHEIVEHINGLLVSPKDRMLVRRRWVEGYGPQDLCRLYPDIWRSPNQVSQDLNRIKNLLAQDALLKRWFADEAEEN